MRSVIDTVSSSSLLFFLLSYFINLFSLRSPLFSHLYTITREKATFFLKAYFPAIGEPPFSSSNTSSTLCRRFSNGLQNCTVNFFKASALHLPGNVTEPSIITVQLLKIRIRQKSAIRHHHPLVQCYPRPKYLYWVDEKAKVESPYVELAPDCPLRCIVFHHLLFLHSRKERTDILE